MTETTASQPLAPGMVVQYKKVGTARLVARDRNQPDRPMNDGWWSVEWIKAPKRYRDGLVGDRFWIRPDWTVTP